MSPVLRVFYENKTSKNITIFLLLWVFPFEDYLQGGGNIDLQLFVWKII